MTENVQLKQGRDSSEYGIVRLLILAGLALMLGALAMLGFGKVNTGDPGWAAYLDFLKWIAGIGAGLCGAVATWYTAKRTDLKKTLTTGLMLLCVLGLLAAPALAGTVTGDSAPSMPATSAPATTSKDSVVTDTVKAGWNAIKKALNLEQDGEPLTPAQTAALLEAINKLSQQNTQLKADVDAAKAQSLVLGAGNGANQYDALMLMLAARVNQQRVLAGLGNAAYGGGQVAYGAAGQAAPAMTAADIRQAVKDELKANETWWDKAPWYVRVPITIGTLAIFKDLGISLPGIN